MQRSASITPFPKAGTAPRSGRQRSLPALTERDLRLLAEPAAQPANAPRASARSSAVAEQPVLLQPQPPPPASAAPRAKRKKPAPASLNRRRQLEELVRVHAEGMGAIARDTEARILTYGVESLGLSLDESRDTLRRIAQGAGAPIQSDAERAVQRLLATSASRRSGRITRADFDRAALLLVALTAGRLPAAALRRRVKEMMIEGGWRPLGRFRLPFTTLWFRRI